MKTIQLNKLSLSEKNVRKTRAENGLDELIASIKSHGLLENLIVVKTANDNYEVVGGGRRLRALQALAKEGHIKNNKSISCEVVDIEQAEEISLAENQVRSAMHPADQFEAWAKLVDNGLSIADIAARFGTNEKLVKQRLKLGKVSPVLMQAYKDEKVTLDILMAFTVTEDHAKQEEVLESVLQRAYVSAGNIKEELIGEAYCGSHKLAKFVGVEAYKKAGGYIKCDLFSEGEDSVYFEDTNLVIELAEKKLFEEANMVEGKWKWFEAVFDFGYEEKGEYQQLESSFIKDVPNSLTKKLEKIEEELSQVDYWSDEGRELKSQRESIEEEIDKYKGFTEEEMSQSGFVVHLNYDGELIIDKGLIRAEDIKQVAKSDSEEVAADTKKEKPLYSKALCDSLKNYRLHSIKNAVANDYESSFDLALYSMCCTSFKGDSFCYIKSLDVKCGNYEYPAQMRNDDETLIAMIEVQEEFYKKLPLDWMKITDEVERYEAMCALSAEDKQRLFAACVSRTVRPQLSNENYTCPIFEQVGKNLEVNVSESWWATESNLFGRLAKSTLLKIGRELIGEEWAIKNMNLKKKAIAELLEDFIQNPSSKKISNVQIEIIKKWLPEGMAF